MCIYLYKFIHEFVNADYKNIFRKNVKLKVVFLVTSNIVLVLNLSSTTLAIEASESDLQNLQASQTATFAQNKEDESQLLDLNANFVPSASIKRPVNIRSLLKKTFRADESVNVAVDYARANDIETTLFNSDGSIVQARIDIVSDNLPVAFRISPPRNFKPGRYRIRVKALSGEEMTQDFTWGVLAINTNKSIYLPNETAKLYLAVLNETGEMVCDADIILEIIDPNGVRNTMSTSNNNIKVNPVCMQKIYTLEPDYEARYQTSVPGNYLVNLTAKTQNGSYSIQDSFQVQENVQFDIERDTITRVFPPATYPVVFDITANQDFEGTVQEVVPDNFEIMKHPEYLKHDEEVVMSSSDAEKSILEAPIFDISLPFKGERGLTQGFGGISRDPLLKAKYARYGVLGHDGVDFALPFGSEVTAVDKGKVLIARENFDYGTTVVVEHSWGKSYYGHLSKINVEENQIIDKNEVIALSGNSGLSSGPHLHFGIKPNKNDTGNGYFGKINPLPYLKMYKEDQLNPQSINISSNNGSVRILKWNLKIKKGDRIKLGYLFKSPSESPQFYLLGPVEFRSTIMNEESKSDLKEPENVNSENTSEEIEKNKSFGENIEQNNDDRSEIIFQESRQWQLAIDADGSGTMSVDPSTGVSGESNQTYTFTFTPSETMDSGEMRILVPSGWTDPTGIISATGNNLATVATVLNSNDSASGWSVTGNTTGDFCETASGLNTSVFTEGTGSIECTDPDTDSDTGDAIIFDYGSGQDWSAYSEIGFWIRVSATESSPNAAFGWNDDGDLHTSVIGTSAIPSVTANTWTYVKLTLSGTLTSIRSYGVRCTSNTCSLSDGNSFYIDEILIGPGSPTVSGSGPWNINVRLLDATSTDTISVVYGSGGTVTNSSTPGSHEFTTYSRVDVNGSLTNITIDPTICLDCGPTNEQLLRHGGWFSNGVKQPFTF